MIIKNKNKLKTMTQKEENAKTVLEAIKDLFEGREELSHMSGDLELCGMTADNVLREMKEEERRNNQ